MPTVHSKSSNTAARQNLSGFTVIEVLLVIAIFAIITGFTSINLLKPQTKASVETTATTLVSDLKEQQLKAMAGDGEGQSSAQYFGIYFESNRYTLFRGSYVSGDANNFIVNLNPSITLTNNLPVSPGNQIVFVKRSGEAQNYASGSDSVTLRNTTTGEQKILTINRYGAITAN